MTFRLAHVTDPHFRSFVGARLGHFLGKRALGALNLIVNRRRVHRMELLEEMGADLRARAPDHLVVTGDLSNVSLEGEWAAARAWLERYGGGGDSVTVIPGNHDAYVPEVVEKRVFETLFAPYMNGDVRPADDVYPFARMRGGVALLGVNTCVATGDMHAWGRIGAAQLERLEALLTAPEVRDRVRVVLLHHPPVAHRGGEDRNLRDRAALAEVFHRAGAELILHGHDHRDLRIALDGPGGAKIPVVGVGSASYAGRPDHRARYNLYEIDGRTITAVTYAHDESVGSFRETRREVLAG